MKTIGLVKGRDRYENVLKSLELIKNEVLGVIKGKKRVLVKVNFVSAKNQAAATHVDSVRALLDFLKPIYEGKIKIVETGKKAWEGFDRFGYLGLPGKYRVQLDNLGRSPITEIPIWNINLKQELKARLYTQALEADFLISLTPPKTHDWVMATLGLKNVAVGFLENPSLIHQGYRAINKNVFLLSQKIYPHLSVIDGTVGMEGNGPLYGQAVDSDWALASLNAFQADVVGAKLMGFEPRKVGYLNACLEKGLATDDWSRVEIRGEKLESCGREFVRPDNYENQLRWALKPGIRERTGVFLAEKVYTPMVSTPLGNKLAHNPLAKKAKRLFGFQ